MAAGAVEVTWRTETRLEEVEEARAVAEPAWTCPSEIWETTPPAGAEAAGAELEALTEVVATTTGAEVEEVAAREEETTTTEVDVEALADEEEAGAADETADEARLTADVAWT